MSTYTFEFISMVFEFPEGVSDEIIDAFGHDEDFYENVFPHLLDYALSRNAKVAGQLALEEVPKWVSLLNAP